MNAIRVSAATSSDGATCASAEELEAAALVLSVVDLPATKLRTLAQAIVRHTRQACSEAEKRGDELEQILTNAIDKLDEFDVAPCVGCRALVDCSKSGSIHVDAHGLYCSKDCGREDGAICLYCDRATDGEEDGFCSESCAKRMAAEVQQ